MVRCLGVASRAWKFKDVRQSWLVGEIQDECQDSATISQQLHHYRYVKDGRVDSAFSGIDNLHTGDSNTVFKSTLFRLEKDQIPIWSVGGLGSDGCSVLRGTNNGVVAKLKDINPTCVDCHCVCHRQALGCVDAANDVEYTRNTFFPVLGQVGRHYDYSAKKMQSLLSTQEDCGFDPLKLCKNCFTRWLSHDQVTETLEKRLIPVLLDLSQRGDADPVNPTAPADATAKGLFKIMCTKEFISTLLLMRDVLPDLRLLSKNFQQRNNDLTVVETFLPPVLRRIEALIETPGENYRRREEVLKAVTDAGLELGGHPKRDEAWMEKTRRQYLGCLRDRLKARFPDDKLMSALAKLFYIKHYPKDKTDTYDAGLQALELAAAHYSKPIPVSKYNVKEKVLIDPKRLKEEWPLFYDIYSSAARELEGKFLGKYNAEKPPHAPKLLDLPMAESLHMFLTDSRFGVFTEMAKLAIATLIIPSDSCDCERSFSLMKFIKRPLRNGLSQATLEQLLHIKLNGPDLSDKKAVDQLLREALRVWYGGANPERGNNKKVKRRVKLSLARPTIDALDLNPVWGLSYGDSEEGVLEKQERKAQLQKKIKANNAKAANAAKKTNAPEISDHDLNSEEGEVKQSAECGENKRHGNGEEGEGKLAADENYDHNNNEQEGEGKLEAGKASESDDSSGEDERQLSAGDDVAWQGYLADGKEDIFVGRVLSTTDSDVTVHFFDKKSKKSPCWKFSYFYNDDDEAEKWTQTIPNSDFKFLGRVTWAKCTKAGKSKCQNHMDPGQWKILTTSLRNLQATQAIEIHAARTSKS